MKNVTENVAEEFKDIACVESDVVEEVVKSGSGFLPKACKAVGAVAGVTLLVRLVKNTNWYKTREEEKATKILTNRGYHVSKPYEVIETGEEDSEDVQ